MRVLSFLTRLAGFAAAIPLLTAPPAGAQVIISEFMADNQTGLQDEDGDYSDWIELYNAGGAPVDLGGWHLTDSPADLVRWTFPTTNLPAGGFLVIHASGKDRAAPRLHANFSLAADGEYLALVRPDGITREHEYAPTYPQQFPDISYGLQTHGTNPTLRAGKAGYLIRRTAGTANSCLPAPHPLFSDDSVCQIDLTLSQAVWDRLMDDPLSDIFQPVDVRFRHGDIDLFLPRAGLRCRGNTTRSAQPRSFLLSFNAFIPDQQLLGMEKLNLNSTVVDPSTARTKLVHDLHAAAGLPMPYANHAAVVIHGPTNDRGTAVGGSFFDAIRSNIQPVDDVFLAQRFGNKRGNLYQCNRREWKASLEYRGPDGSAYIGDGSTYELEYPGAGDNSYQDLATFIATINQTSDAQFPRAILEVFDVDGFLKRLALDVLTANYDNYWLHSQNYYLFHDPDTRRWVYVPYDFDISFGINWEAVDWTMQNVHNWTNGVSQIDNTPLVRRILNVFEFRSRYSFYLRQMLDAFYSNAKLDPVLFHCRASLAAPLPFPDSVSVTNMKLQERDRYVGYSPQWTYLQFWNSYETSQVGWDRGITDFIGLRRESAAHQLSRTVNIGPILTDFTMAPNRPRSHDAITVSIHAVDDVVVSNVVFIYSFQAGPDISVAMTRQADGDYAAILPACGAPGTLRYQVCAFDDTGKATFHPYGGSDDAAIVDIESPGYDLAITELNYNPHVLTPAEMAEGITDVQNLEFVEVFNRGHSALDISGFKLQDGIAATFPPFTLGPGEYAVVAKNTNAFRVRYPNASIRIVGTYSGNLSNGGETVRLEDRQGGILASIAFSDSDDWPGRADGDGSSIELIDLALGYADPANWRSSSEYGGSPGAAGLGPDNRIVVNEILTHTDPPFCDRIELFNTTAGAISIGGWYLSDSKSNYRKYTIPAGTILPAGGYVVFNETNHFNTSGGANTNDFALDGAHGENVYLLQTDAQGRLQRFVDRVESGAAANGESFGRWPNGSGRLYPMLTPTFGTANLGPRVGPLFISEVMYHPPSGSNHLEFIEIANPTDVAVSLDRWQIDGGIAFTFTNGVLPPGGVLAILSFDPNAASNSALLAGFCLAYGITNEVLLAGPYSDSLSDAGERIRLMRPAPPPADEPAFIPRLIEDEVKYACGPPWPTAAAGTGASLSRLVPAAWGDSATSWRTTSNPTPGLMNSTATGFHLWVAAKGIGDLAAINPATGISYAEEFLLETNGTNWLHSPGFTDGAPLYTHVRMAEYGIRNRIEVSTNLFDAFGWREPTAEELVLMSNNTYRVGIPAQTPFFIRLQLIPIP